MKKIYILAFLFCLSSSLLRAQHDAMYTQYMFNMLLINPAYAGSADALDVTVMNRNQWVGFEGAPRTSTFSAHSPLKNNRLNFGISVTDDQFGLTHQDKINLMYAYRIRFRKSTLFLGVEGGMNMVRTNLSQVATTTPGDQVFYGQDEHHLSPEAGFGIYYKTKRFYAGLSAPSLYPDNSVEKISEHPWLLTSGYVLDLSEDFRLKPSVLFKYIPASPLEADVNLNLYYKAFGLGLSYRTNDALAFLAEINLNAQMKAGYAYDLTLSRIGTYSRGSHEIMLRYTFAYAVKAKNPRYF